MSIDFLDVFFAPGQDFFLVHHQKGLVIPVKGKKQGPFNVELIKEVSKKKKKNTRIIFISDWIDAAFIKKTLLQY